MSRVEDQFTMDLGSAEAELACKQAIASIGWGVKSAEPSRIVPRIGVGISRNPSSIEVLIDGESPARVRLMGKIVGFGPVQKRHLVAEMNKLRNAIEVAAHALS